MAKVFERVQNIIAKKLGADKAKIVESASFIDLGAGSLDMVELFVTLEDEFGVAIPEEATDRLRTVGAVVKYIQKHS